MQPNENCHFSSSMLSIVNKNYRTKLTSKFTFNELANLLPNSRLYYKPRMIRIRTAEKYTILIFNSLTTRIMGRGDNHQGALEETVKDFLQIINPIILQSMTLIYNINRPINLHRLNPKYFLNLMELFPSCIMCDTLKAHVNVFASGKIVMTGIKSHLQAYEIIADINKKIKYYPSI